MKVRLRKLNKTVAFAVSFLISLSVLAFLPQAQTSNPTLITTTVDTDAESPSQRHLVTTSLGVLLKFYSNNTHLLLKVSTDNGTNWTLSKPNGSSDYAIRASTSNRQFSIWYDASYNISRIWYVWSPNAASSSNRVRRGVLNSTQTGIAWGTEYSFGTASASIYNYYPNLVVEVPSGTLRAFTTRATATVGYLRVDSNPNNDGSGSWTGVGNINSEASSGPWENSATSLSGNKSYVVYHQDAAGTKLWGRRWNGTAFDAEAQISYFAGSHKGTGRIGISIANDGDEAYAAFESSSNLTGGSAETILMNTIWANNSLKGVEQVSTSGGGYSGAGPSVSRDKANNVTVVAWGDNNDFYFRVYRNGVWEDIGSVDGGPSLVVEYSISTPWSIKYQDHCPSSFWQGDGLNPWNIYFYMYDYEAVAGYNLNLRVRDWDLTDNIQGAVVYKDSDTQTSDANGWANWTGVSGTVQIKVKYYGFWVNGTFSVSVTSDTTINVKCKLYDVTVTVQESHGAYIASANVTAFNATSTSANKIKSGVTGSNGQVSLPNLPNNTLTFTQYAGSSYSTVIGNATQAISSDGQAFTVTSDQNYVSTSNSYGIIALVGSVIFFKKGRKQPKTVKGGEKENVGKED